MPILVARSVVTRNTENGTLIIRAMVILYDFNRLLNPIIYYLRDVDLRAAFRKLLGLKMESTQLETSTMHSIVTQHGTRGTGQIRF